jgi:hypothetical protein
MRELFVTNFNKVAGWGRRGKKQFQGLGSALLTGQKQKTIKLNKYISQKYQSRRISKF